MTITVAYCWNRSEKIYDLCPLQATITVYSFDECTLFGRLYPRCALDLFIKVSIRKHVVAYFALILSSNP